VEGWGLGGLGRREKNEFFGVFLFKPLLCVKFKAFNWGKYGIFEYNDLVHLSTNPNHLWWILFNCLLYIIASDPFCAIESTIKIAVETAQKNEDS
jgi:hypothetical protein